MKVVPSLEELYIVVESQSQGITPIFDECIAVFDSQFIALTTGVDDIPFGDIAASFACDTAEWCYKHVRQRPYYWEDKIRLLFRIFRTTNLSLWQKRKETNYSNGLASTLCIALLGTLKIWVGSIGNNRVYLIREGLIEELVPPESQQSERITTFLGFERSGINPRCISETMISGDVVLLCSEGVADFVSEDDIRISYEVSGSTKESCHTAVQCLLDLARDRGSRENASVCLIKKR